MLLALPRYVLGLFGLSRRERAPTALPLGQRAPWAKQLGFVLLQLACVAVIWVGWSPAALIVAAALYLVRMFAITGFYHRYFSHRTFRTNRFWQFVFALLGASAMQRGPLWWAAHHRHHHRHSDRPEDVHSPVQYGFWQSHTAWFLAPDNWRTDYAAIPDLARYPELRLVDRFDKLVPVLLAVACFGLGLLLARLGVDTGPWQMLVWGFFVSTTVLANATYCINSLAHVMGSRRYATSDDSRNNFALALITLGEGWHNNHHRYPASARQGFRWHEIDITWYGLRLLAALRIVRDLKPVPASIVAEGRRLPIARADAAAPPQPAAGAIEHES